MKASVCGRCLHEEEGCGCVRGQAHRRGGLAAGNERGRSLREESVLQGGTTGHGYHIGPQAGCRAVCCVVVSIQQACNRSHFVCLSIVCNMSQENRFTEALRSTCLLSRANIPSVSVHDGLFLSRLQCAVQMIALLLLCCCRMSRIGSADVAELNDGCCVNKKMVEAKMLHRTSRRCLSLALTISRADHPLVHLQCQRTSTSSSRW